MCTIASVLEEKCMPQLVIRILSISLTIILTRTRTRRAQPYHDAGCPKPCAVSSGMGTALLSRPEETLMNKPNPEPNPSLTLTFTLTLTLTQGKSHEKSLE